MKPRTLAITAFAIAGMIFAACGGDSEEIGDRDPDIRGEITDVGFDDNGKVVSVFVQGESDAFFLRVSDDTDIFRLEDARRVEASREDLRAGQQVDAWAGEEINPSEPPQGNAVRVVITDRFEGGPDIRGMITSVTPGSGDVLGTVLIEGRIEPDTGYDKASVRVEEDTEIFMRQGTALVEATWSAVAEGLVVEAWFEGPVAESYPVQAKAGRIVITGFPQD